MMKLEDLLLALMCLLTFSLIVIEFAKAFGLL